MGFNPRQRAAMPKKIMWANVHVPQYPRVRFFVKNSDPGQPFLDITQRVTKLIVEEMGDPTGTCALYRFDEKDQLVWKTLHPSLQETKWHVEFEYGLPEEKWTPYNGTA
jgi:hypothetical protein